MIAPALPTDFDNEPNDPEEEDGECNGHPLFPRAITDTGPDRRRFDWILVVRYMPDGTREVCPKMYRGSELRSWQQILDEHGGGCTYQLGAQKANGHQFTAWSEKCYFASPAPKSFQGGPWVPKQDPSNAALAPSPQSTHDALLVMLVKLLADRPPPPPPPNPVEMLQACATLFGGFNRQPNPYEFFKDMMPLMNGGERTSRTFKEGIEFAREIYKNAPAAEPARSNSDDIGDMMNLAKLFMASRPANSAPPPAPPPPPPPPPPQLQNAFAPPCPPPPGYGWLYTQQGWIAFPMAMTNSQFATPVAPAPISQPPAPAAAAPPAQIMDEDALLRKLLEHPETRAKLQTLLGQPAAPAPMPPPAPPAPIPAPPVAPVAAPVPAPAQTPPAALQTPEEVLSEQLLATGWSFTSTPETPVAMHYTKNCTPVPAAMVSPAQPPQETSLMIPDDVPMDDELREMLSDPGFQQIASAVLPPEAQGAFNTLVQKNTKRLREIPEA